jgi:tripartite ATP-independent transporter DctM subunit
MARGMPETPGTPAVVNGAAVEVDDLLQRRAHAMDPIERAAEVVVVLALVAELVAMFGNVIFRSLLNSSLLWSLEIAELALVVITFLGGAIAYPRNEHMALQAVVQRLPRRWRGPAGTLCHWQVFVMAVIGCWLAYQMMLSRWEERTPYLALSAVWFATPMIIGMAMLAYFAVRRVLLRPWREVAVTGVVVGAAVAAVIGLTMTLGVDARSYALSVAFGIFALQLIFGVPIGFALLMVTLLYLYTSKIVPPSVVPINMQSGVSSFVMLSIPFFILAGYMMTEGGLTRRLTNFIIIIIGRFRGGMLQVIVVSMYIMSGISGSKIADVAAVGTTMKTVMRKEGYEPGETAAVLAAGAIMGETVPPSIAMLILSSVTSLSIGTMFAAGLLPAAVIAVCLMILIYLRSRGRPRTVTPWSIGAVARTGMSAIPALAAPVILIGGIITGIATPTEVSSTAVMYALLLSVLFYRELKAKQLWMVLSRTAAQSGMILFITATSSTLSWSLALAKIPQRMAELFSVLQGSTVLFMLATIVTLVLMGALLEGIPALLIFGPLLLPLTGQFAVDPIQFGMVLVIAMGLGAFSPPIGVGIFATCSIADTTMESTTRHMIPYLVVLVIGLLLVALVPWFSLVVPRMLG